MWDLRTNQCVQVIASHEAEAKGINHKFDHIHNPNTPNPDMIKSGDRKKSKKNNSGTSVDSRLDRLASVSRGDCLSWCYVHHPMGNCIFVSTDKNLLAYAYEEVEDPKVADALTTTVCCTTCHSVIFDRWRQGL